MLCMLTVSRSTNLSEGACGLLSSELSSCMLEHEAGTAEPPTSFSLVLLHHGLEWNKAIKH